MGSRCSPAGPLRSVESEKFPSSPYQARRIGHSRRGGRLHFRCWTGCPAFGREAGSPCRWRARLPRASASPRSSYSNKLRMSGCRSRSATSRSRPSPAPMRGWWCPAGLRGLLQARRSMPICCGTDWGSKMTSAHLPKNRDNVDQDQFLNILSREDALARFEAALFPRAIPSELRPLSDALGCALAADIVAPIDVPRFDRSNVDGFAARSADLASAGEATPVCLMLNDEVIACGTTSTRPVLSGTATSIATGGPLPRGADAVVMVEHTQPAGPRTIEIRRAASPGQFVSYAGSDIARGEVRLGSGTVIGSRESAICAACAKPQGPAARRPPGAVLAAADAFMERRPPLR